MQTPDRFGDGVASWNFKIDRRVGKFKRDFSRSRSENQLVIEGNGLKNGSQWMIVSLVSGPDAEEKVDLSRAPNAKGREHRNSMRPLAVVISTSRKKPLQPSG